MVIFQLIRIEVLVPHGIRSDLVELHQRSIWIGVCGSFHCITNFYFGVNVMDYGIHFGHCKCESVDLLTEEFWET